MKKTMRWLLVLICISVIAHFSNQPLAEQDLRPVIEQHSQIIKLVNKMPQITFNYNGRIVDSKDTVNFIHFMLRKLAHLTIYGILGLLLLYGFAGIGKIRPLHWILTAIIISGTAAADEINQIANSSRTGCKEDIILDFAGFVIFSMTAVFCYCIRNCLSKKSL